MRWQQLFADLEAQLDESARSEFAAEVRDRSRHELSLVRLVDRLRPSVGQQVGVRLPTIGMLDGTLSCVGADWLLLAEAGGREALIPLHAIAAIGGLGPVTAVPNSEGWVAARLGFAYALRGLARDRAGTSVYLIDGSTVAGTLDRIGADFVELATHPAGEPRRRDLVRAVLEVPMCGIVALRTG
jgi:hypothetical protein